MNNPRSDFARKNVRAFLWLWMLFFTFFALVFQADEFGSTFWATVITTFIVGTNVFVTWNDRLSDEEVMQKLNRGAA